MKKSLYDINWFCCFCSLSICGRGVREMRVRI